MSMGVFYEKTVTYKNDEERKKAQEKHEQQKEKQRQQREEDTKKKEEFMRKRDEDKKAGKNTDSLKTTVKKKLGMHVESVDIWSSIEMK